jgi:adenylate cyclase
MSEKLQPEQVVEVLNRYLSKMTDIVFKHEGTLDKYVGDEIMATYNVPLDLEDHAVKAVQTAIEMQKTAQSMGKELKYGIGINTGEAIVGNIGSSKRLDYTVIGDSVNLGARLCGKAEPNQILISESTNNLVKEFIKTKSIGEIMVKGKEKPLRVYEVIY